MTAAWRFRADDPAHAAYDSVSGETRLTDAAAYLVETVAELDEMNTPVEAGGETDFCTLVDHDEDGEERVLAASLYRFPGFKGGPQ